MLGAVTKSVPTCSAPLVAPGGNTAITKLWLTVNPFDVQELADALSITVDDLRPGRLVVVDPAPIPEAELRRTYDWMKGWGLLGDVDWSELIDDQRQSVAHQG